MSTVKPTLPKREETPVDDIRRVRRNLSEETGNDVNRLADRARQTAERLRQKLGLRPAKDKYVATVEVVGSSNRAGLSP
jgi:hypothetical protein